MTLNKELYGSATENMKRLREEHDHEQSLKKIIATLKTNRWKEKPLHDNKLKDGR